MAYQKTVKKKSGFRENLEAIVIAVILALFIRTFIVQAFKIPSGSMLPTLQIGDHILVNKFIYGVKVPFSGKVLVPVKDPQQDDIIVFKYPKDPKLDYIKRVIGVAGDTVEIRNKKVFVNGQPYVDSHGVFRDVNVLSALAGPRDNYGPKTVPPGKLLVMGDNRDNSFDGRFWGFVDLEAVRGKAFLVYWSWDVQKPLFSLDRLASIRWSRFGDIIH
ncbi:signal peptidase I [Desulfogranum mediterraneum]|uniref:signal peptidase I n=1 Tax=Desulfogranum mediterraneum TaxID=160661 RepID=UPI00040A067B|nr:signal peptidase I [Desulfogranum mediterraneum]